MFRSPKWFPLLIAMLLLLTACNTPQEEPPPDPADDFSAGEVIIEDETSGDETTDDPEPLTDEDEAEPAESVEEAGGEETGDDSTASTTDTTDESAQGDDELEELADELLDLTAANNYGEPNVDSYALSLFYAMTTTQPDGSTDIGGIIIEGQRDVVGDALTYTVLQTGTANLDPSLASLITFTQLITTTYFQPGDGTCLSLAGSSDLDLYSIFLADGGVLGAVEGAQPATPFLTTVNGVDVRHHLFDQTALIAAGADADLIVQQGDVWTAVDGGHIVRLQMIARGMDAIFGQRTEGEIGYRLNYSDFNRPVNITRPASCALSGPPAGLPTLPDPYDVSSLQGVYTYYSDTDLTTARDFYVREMEALGWRLASEAGSGPATFLTFTKDGETIQVSLTGQGTAVMVALIGTP